MQEILKLYPEFTDVLGPYYRKDGRQHIVLNKSHLPKNAKGKLKTISYPKALLEIKMGRRLFGDETVDHIDNDFTNNNLDNLQILTRSENAKKGLISGRCLVYGKYKAKASVV